MIARTQYIQKYRESDGEYVKYTMIDDNINKVPNIFDTTDMTVNFRKEKRKTKVKEGQNEAWNALHMFTE